MNASCKCVSLYFRAISMWIISNKFIILSCFKADSIVFLQSDFQNKAESLSIRIRQNHFRFIVHRRIKWIVGDFFVQNKDYTFPANKITNPSTSSDKFQWCICPLQKKNILAESKYIKIDFMCSRTIGKRPKHTNYACGSSTKLWSIKWF
jgi:hypothetical protein